MQRRMRAVVAAAAVAGLLTATAACSSKSSEDSSHLQIVPVTQIDAEGQPVEAPAESDALNPAGDGNATCAPATIATAGALTGPDSALGINIRNGAELAIDQHNANNPNCQISLKPFDTEGDPQKATQVAPTIINDQSIIGLIGPGFSGETKATGGTFDQAGLVAVTASATNPDLSGNGWQTFFRGLANDAAQGPAVAKYLTGEKGMTKVCVIKDDTDYGIGLASQIIPALGAANDPSCAGDVKKGERDFQAVLTKVTSAKPDAVFFAGYYAEAAPFARQLHDAAPDVVFVSGDGANDPQFVQQAGSAAKGAILSCPCGPGPKEFTEAYTAKFNQPPGVYSTEAYDLAAILIKGITEGNSTRPELLAFVRGYSGTGLARQYQWTPNGELTATNIWIYEVKEESGD